MKILTHRYATMTLPGYRYSINSDALPDVSLRSYQLTSSQKEDAKKGILDIVTGFTIIDNEQRIIVVEGLGGVYLNPIREHSRLSS